MDIHLVQTTVSNGSFSTVWISMEDPDEMRLSFYNLRFSFLPQIG